MSALVLVQHAVGTGPFSDFDAWKRAFDSDPAGRAQHGAVRHWVYRSPGADYVVIGLEFPTVDEAERFRNDLEAALGEVWKQMGAESPVRVLEQVETVSYETA
jgi:hypothetical protein